MIKNKPVIICVDDEKFILDTLNRQLQRHFGDAYDYEFAESAEEALDIINELSQSGCDVVMVLSDQIMPGMTGDKFLINVQKANPKSIKILLTGQASLESAINIINNANLFRFLTKPWSEEDLLLTIEKGLKEYSLIEENAKQIEIFSQYVPKQFLECLSKKTILDVKLGDYIQRNMTILFSDIRNFTTISEKLSPEETYLFINSYLSYIEPAIRTNNGFIDKYIGDAVMVLFNDQKDAVKAAIDMQRAIVKFNKDNVGKVYCPLSIGTGLHTGNLLLGVVGVESRLQGTVTSEAVNLASRIQDISSFYGINIAVSEDIIHDLQGMDISSRYLGKIRMKGITKEIEIFEILDPESDHFAKYKIETAQALKKGLSLFCDKKFKEACQQFDIVLKKNPDDKVARFYLERAEIHMTKGVPEAWCGVETIYSRYV